MSEKKSKESTTRINNEIENVNKYDRLNHKPFANPNENYFIIENTIKSAIDKHMPFTRVKFDKHINIKRRLIGVHHKHT